MPKDEKRHKKTITRHIEDVSINVGLSKKDGVCRSR